MTITVDGFEPTRSIEKPTSLGEVSSILSDADNSGFGVIPIGGGTGLHVGGIPTKYDIAIHMTGFKSVVSHNPADLTCTVEAGITLGELQAILAEHGQFLAIDAPFPERSTVGGIMSSLPTGYLRWQLGHPRDTVIGMEVLLPSGTITKSGGQVVKNVSGYDMSRLHIGGFGSLGVISKISFKLTPKPRGELTIRVFFNDDKSMHEFVGDIFSTSLMPLAAACTHNNTYVKDKGESLDYDSICYIRIGGGTRSLAKQTSMIETIAANHSAVKKESVGTPRSESLWQEIRDYSEKQFEVIGRISSVPSNIHAIEEDLSKKLDELRVGHRMICQPGFGTALLFIEGIEAQGSESGVRTLRSLRQTVNAYNGTLVYEKIPILWKHSIDVWNVDRIPALHQMRTLKQTYDPNWTMSSGRFVV